VVLAEELVVVAKVAVTLAMEAAVVVLAA